MSKYAFVLSCSKNYMYGLNAILNALDYYGNTADVHVLWLEHNVREFDKMSPIFLEKLRKQPFNFKVHIVNIFDVIKPFKYKMGSNVWVLKFSRWKYLDSIKDDYDSICALGADIVVTDNIMEWFEVTANTDFIVTGRNALGSYKFHSDVPVHTNDTPCADVPAYFNPKTHNDFSEKIWEIGMKYNMGDMPAFYFAAKATNKRMILLPDNLWIRNFSTMNDRLHHNLGCYKQKNEKIFLESTVMRHKVSMIHGKWWAKGHVYKRAKDAEGAPNHKLVKDNVELYHKLFKLFNTEHKLQVEWLDV